MNDTKSRNIMNELHPNSINKQDSCLEKHIRDKIVLYLKEQSFSNPQWIEAISSQYFLIETAFLLDSTELPSYKELENSFFDNSCSFRDGVVLPSPTRILVVPDENEKLIARMQKEEDDGAIYVDRLKAKRINTREKKDLIFYNYYYGLMAGIINRFCQKDPANNNYKSIRNATISELLSSSSLDEAGGWVHYRLPWITARIIISLSTYMDEDIDSIIKEIGHGKITDANTYNDFIKATVASLIMRLHTDSLWKSGAGDWVTCWESTGLCLEAIFVSGQIKSYIDSINKIVNYLCFDENSRQWLKEPSFISESVSNQTLASVILSSVLYRLFKKQIIDDKYGIKDQILAMFKKLSTIIQEGEQLAVQQHCTIPQIMYYILIALN